MKTKVLMATVSVLALAAAGCAHNRDSAQTQAPNRTAGAVIDDAGLTAKVKTAIAKDVGVGTAANVNVTTYRGEVQLSGFIDSQDKSTQAENAARGVSGVQSVRNDLQVKSAA